MNYKRFDADRHVIEPITLWQDYMDTAVLKDYPITIDASTQYYIADMPVFANIDKTLNKPNTDFDNDTLQQQQDAMTPQGQLKSMDETHIAQAVLHPTVAGFIVNHGQIPAKISLSFAQAYNRWLKDFCRYNPSRLLGAALVSRHEPKNLVMQINDIIKQGFRYITLRPEVIAGKTLGHKDYDSFWQTCEANNIAVTIHGGNHLDGTTAGTERFSHQFALHACAHSLEVQMAFLSLVESGVLERFPKLRFVFLEAGASWIVHWLWRLDNISYPTASLRDLNHVKMKPSEYFKRQCWVAIEPEEHCLRQVADIVGHEKLLFGSDYPHLDHHHIDEHNMKANLSDFSDTEIKDILHHNACQFFDIKTTQSKLTESPITDHTTTKDASDSNANDLVWHPKYNVYFHQNSALLVSETSAFCLRLENFPYLSALNDGLNLQQILKTQADPQQAALGLYQTKQLQNQDVVIEKGKKKQLNYTQIAVEEPTEIAANRFCKIISLSTANKLLQQQWTDILTLQAQTQARQQKAQPITFLLVDDFLHHGINDLLEIEPNWCLIKISGDKLMITSYSTLNNPIAFNNLQRQLWQNQPIRQLVKTLFPNKNNNLAFNSELKLSTVAITSINNILNSQLNALEHNIGIYDVATCQIEYHPINTYFDSKLSFSQQVESPINLEPCQIKFKQDGGSRSVSTEQTLEQLNRLISPITGIFTHIKLHSNNISGPDNCVKIYETGFFKTPNPMQYNRLDNGHFVQQSYGKGIETNQSKASSLGEALERYAAHYQGEEPLFIAKQSQLKARYYSFKQLAPFSALQYQDFAQNRPPNRHSIKQKLQSVEPYNDSSIHWLTTWSLTHEQPVKLPLTCCLYNLPFDDERFGKWNSNGCAAGNTIEEAIIQGLYEVIERDAIGIWWYNKIQRPAFDLTQLDPQSLAKLKASLEDTHHFWVLDLTTDIGVPVMAAVGQDKTNNNYAFGFGCHLEPQLAAQRALTELCQMIPIEDQNKGAFDPEAIAIGPYLQAQNHLQAATKPIKAHKDIKQDIEAIVATLNQLGFETLALNYSRAHIPLKTTKVFVPGLCHMWPQLGNERLYQIPVKLGWLEEANSEATLNPQPLYV